MKAPRVDGVVAEADVSLAETQRKTNRNIVVTPITDILVASDSPHVLLYNR